MLISKFISAGCTDIGKVRPTNEDHFLVADLGKSMTIHSSTLPVDDETELYSGLKGQLLLVADGMGGNPGGGVASQIGIGTAAKYVLNTMPWFFSLDHDRDDDQQDELLEALRECEQAVEAEAGTHPEWNGMGTTLTMAYIVWPRMYVVHIGDSRCYLLRGRRLLQLTDDHTVAQALVDDGTITQEQAAGSPFSHVLVNSIGHGPAAFHPDVHKTRLEPGDKVLLCTDGLNAHIGDDQIASILSNSESAEEAAKTLIDAANARGGTDNVTAVVSICNPPIDLPPRKERSETREG